MWASTQKITSFTTNKPPSQTTEADPKFFPKFPYCLQKTHLFCLSHKAPTFTILSLHVSFQHSVKTLLLYSLFTFPLNILSPLSHLTLSLSTFSPYILSILSSFTLPPLYFLYFFLHFSLYFVSPLPLFSHSSFYLLFSLYIQSILIRIDVFKNSQVVKWIWSAKWITIPYCRLDLERYEGSTSKPYICSHGIWLLA